MSSGKFRSRTKNVKVINPGDHDPAQCNHQVNGKFIHYKPQRATDGKEMVKVYDHDGTRELIVPNRNPLDLPGIISRSEMQRLKNQAHVITYQDRKAMLAEAERIKIQLHEESDQRKEILRISMMKMKPTKTSKLSEVESEATRKNLYMLQRANELREEQEDEMKKANSLILASKCFAIREAQIAEKELMKQEMEEEERRLDMLMEQQRQKTLQKEDEREQRRRDRTHRYIQEVTQQIQENEVQKLIEAEKKEEECRLMNKALIAMQRENEELLRQKKEEGLRLQRELNQANLDMERYKMIQKEEERVCDLRIKDFMQKKLAREEAREAEIMAEKAAKEREIARMHASQQKAQDLQAKIEELNTLRIQEESERKWREKEKAEAKKRKELADQIRLEREKQTEDIRRAQAAGIARDEQDFREATRILNNQYKKDMEKKAKRKADAEQHRKDLLKQINEKERERIQQHHDDFEEGAAIRLETDLRTLGIHTSLKKKMTKLRDNNVPERFVRDIERQLRIK